jgi:outer membrane protein OmpA-like peptidoglycan-associated protein
MYLRVFIFLLFIPINMAAQSRALKPDSIFLRRMETALRRPGDSVMISRFIFFSDFWSPLREGERQQQKLEAIATFLLKIDTVSLEIEVYTECRGNDRYNLLLTQRIAERLNVQFIEAGISPQRFAFKGMGETTMFSPCQCHKTCTEDDSLRNKVLVIKLL